jgi:hypothetical protein
MIPSAAVVLSAGLGSLLGGVVAQVRARSAAHRVFGFVAVTTVAALPARGGQASRLIRGLPALQISERWSRTGPTDSGCAAIVLSWVSSTFPVVRRDSSAAKASPTSATG